MTQNKELICINIEHALLSTFFLLLTVESLICHWPISVSWTLALLIKLPALQNIRCIGHLMRGKKQTLSPLWDLTQIWRSRSLTFSCEQGWLSGWGQGWCLGFWRIPWILFGNALFPTTAWDTTGQQPH